jgi:hypothetical protein
VAGSVDGEELNKSFVDDFERYGLSPVALILQRIVNAPGLFESFVVTWLNFAELDMHWSYRCIHPKSASSECNLDHGNGADLLYRVHYLCNVNGDIHLGFNIFCTVF